MDANDNGDVGQTEFPLPDFIIAGAMKCGTTSLYSTLNDHPDVFFPELEIGFFDIDDIRQHPDFFKFRRGTWHYQAYDQHDTSLREWYSSLFDASTESQLRGDRSVTYMASTAAPRRIRRLIPNAKLIFMLRDPVPRAYSNYWHLLRSGDVSGSFERSLRYHHNALFERGLYRPQIERYLQYFPRDRVLFIVFEEYMQDPNRTLSEVCRFLGINRETLPSDVDQWENRGRYPWSRTVQYVANATLFRGLLDGQRYLDEHLPHLRSGTMQFSLISRSVFRATTFAFKALSRVNCSRRKRPAMNPDTRRFLKYLYETHNDGLSDLIGKDLSSVWSVTKV